MGPCWSTHSSNPRGVGKHLSFGHTHFVFVLASSKVFRFGTGIASVANTLLRRLKGQKVPLLGSLASSTYGPAKVR